MKNPRGGEKGFKMPCPCASPSGYVVYGQDGRLTYFCTFKQKPCPFYAPVELATCNYCYLDVRIDSVLPGMHFRCPRCGAEYVKTHPGRVTLMKAYAPLTMLQ
ncbi:MAG: hypothetical protein QXL27_09785 [Candidatus Bathyarchaeia archaeon]